MKNRSKQITAVGNSLLARLAGILLVTLALASVASQPLPAAPADTAHNPVIWADVPDIAIIRVGKTYYMSSTTMHMSPGLPIMKSEDLVNWRMASYAYETLADNEALRLENGKDAYGRGSWASSLRFHDGVFYASTFSATSGRTHIYSTRDPERGPWKETSFEPAIGDHSLFFDDDGRAYLVYGNARIELSELKPDLSGIKPGGVHKVIVENVNALFGADQGGLNGEGSQLFKINGRYYLFNIASPGSRWARSVIVNRADAITGPYEGRIVLDDRGIAQGGLIDTPEGKWYAYLFKDNDAVGRIPYLVPVTWKDGWPVLGENGKAPMTLDIPAGGQGVSGASGIVASDEFDRPPGAPALPLAWQWNHNPDNKLWSVTQRPGFLRLTTGRVDADLPSARNTLTQRTFGPRSSATTRIDVSGMKDGDYAGLAAFQKRYGFVGVKMSNGTRSLVMVSADSDHPEEIASVPLSGKTVHLKVECEFEPAPEVARFITTNTDLTNVTNFDTLIFQGTFQLVDGGYGDYYVPTNITKIYLAPGAWVQGKLHFTYSGGVNKRVYGPGVLDGSRFCYALRSCPDDPGDHSLSFDNTPAHSTADTFSLDGIVITDHNHAAADLLVNGSVNNVKSIGWNGLNGGFRLGDNTTVSNVFLRSSDDSLMMWGTNVTVRNATVWQNYNGGVVNLGWGVGSAGDGCLIDGLYVVKTDWHGPIAPNFTKTNLNDQNNAVIDSLMVPGTKYGTVSASLFRNILVEDRPNVLFSLKIVFPECNDPGSPRDGDCSPVDLTLPGVLYLNIENLCSPAAIRPNSIGFLTIPAGFASEYPTNSHNIFPTNYPLSGSIKIGLTNVIIQSTDGTVNPLTSANVAAVAELITNGTNINLSYGFNPDPCLSCLPQLAITSSQTNAILSWPTNFPTFSLEFATNLVPPTVWRTNSTAPSVIGSLSVVTNPITSQPQFYRLKQ